MVEKENGQQELYLNWSEVEECIKDIASQIESHNIGHIYGIPRGGYIPAVMLSHYIKKPMIEMLGNNKQVLVIDDIVDSSKTMNYYRENKYLTAAICTKDFTPNKPDFYSKVYKKNQWIVFPWERI